MDLNMTDLVLFGNELTISNRNKSKRFGGTSLSLDRLNSGVNNKPRDPPMEDDGCELILGLGPTPSLYRNGYSHIGAYEALDPAEKKVKKVPSLAKDVDPGMLRLRLPSEDEDPATSNEYGNLNLPHNLHSGNSAVSLVSDEESTSARLSCGGYMPSLLLAPRSDTYSVNGGISADNDSQRLLQGSPDISFTTTDGSVGVTSGSDPSTLHKVSDSRTHQHHPKKCRFNGCSKGARGATRLCIAHGGGQRCLKPGCHKGAESRTAFCKAHGGGRRCQQLGCTKSAEGKTDFCIAHGGGRRCGHPGCAKAARGKSGLCIRHGGGKRCSVEGCTRSAEGHLGLCISHGGGRRCQYPECTKGAQGSTMHCKAHGGGKRCIFEGCTKGAEGSTPLCKGHGGGKRCLFEGGGACPKSVHGGTDYCVAHGGGKRCAVTGCTKSARGRTDCCVRHGGGKRCKFQECAKSAQGSTDFCKAHGGGKRCTWGQGCEKFARGRSGLCAAHGSIMAARKDRGAVAEGGSVIAAGLFRGLVSHSSKIGSRVDRESRTSSAVSASSQSIPTMPALIPPQVLVPLPIKFQLSTSVGAEGGSASTSTNSEIHGLMVPEGRVHGGGLMSLLGGSFHNVIID